MKNLPESKPKNPRNFRDSDEKLEKGDGLAMALSAAIVFLPILAVLALILVLTFR